MNNLSDILERLQIFDCSLTSSEIKREMPIWIMWRSDIELHENLLAFFATTLLHLNITTLFRSCLFFLLILLIPSLYNVFKLNGLEQFPAYHVIHSQDTLLNTPPTITTTVVMHMTCELCKEEGEEKRKAQKMIITIRKGTNITRRKFFKSN